MAFPQVATTSSGGTTANALTHTVTLPTGIVTGDLLIVLFSQDGTGTASVTTPASGWTANALGTNETALTLLWRAADGNEAADITVTTSDSQCVAWTAYRITGADTATPPEFPTAATNSTNTPDPPSVTASWGSADNLFIAVAGWDVNRTVTAYPANYTANQLTNTSGNATHGTGIATATREVAAATEDPGTFQISVFDGWVATTIVIEAGVVFEVGSGEALAGPAIVEGAGAFTPFSATYSGSGDIQLSPPLTDGAGSVSDPSGEHPVGMIAQRSYGLSGARYGSFAAKAAVADDGTGTLRVPGAQLEGAGAFTVPAYDGSGTMLVSPPVTEGAGSSSAPEGGHPVDKLTQYFFGIFGQRYGSFVGKATVADDGTGALQVPGAQIEGTGAFVTDTYTGSGVILLSPPLVEGTGAIAFPSYTGAGDIQLSPPLTAATGGFAGVGEESGAGDIQVSPPLVEGTGVYADSPLEGYPQIMGTPVCDSGTTSLTHVVTLPTGIQVGELIVVFVAYDNFNGASATVTDPVSGWSEALAMTHLFHFTEIFYRRADGTEGPTITVTLTSSQPAAWSAYRVADVHLTQPFHVHTATTYGNTTSIDIPPSTVPWGVEKTLWIAVGAWEGLPVLDTYPANHTEWRVTCGGGAGGTMGIFTAARYEETATENPDIFSITETAWVSGSVVAFRTSSEEVPAYSGSGEIMLSPPLVDGLGGFAGVGEESGAGALLVPGPQLEGLGAFLAADVGTGEILVSPPLIEGVGEFVAGEPEGTGEILLPPPQVEGEGEYEDPPLGIADLQLSGLQLQATGVYLAFGPCVSTANIDLGSLVSCNTQGQAISANKDC